MRPDSVRMYSGSGPYRVSHPWSLIFGAAEGSLNARSRPQRRECPGVITQRRNRDVVSYVVLHQDPGAAGLHLIYGVIPVSIGGALFGKEQSIRFTLVGAAACREYGLTRPAMDLDVIVFPYPTAIAALLNSGFQESLDKPDCTGRTCTQVDVTTSVPIDFLTGGIRTNDGSFRLRGGAIVVDPLPIPLPSGFGNLAPLTEMIGMKLSALMSGVRVLKLGADLGVRPIEKVNQDLADLRSLISVCNLARVLPLGNQEVQRTYQIYAGGDAVASIS